METALNHLRRRGENKNEKFIRSFEGRRQAKNIN